LWGYVGKKRQLKNVQAYVKWVGLGFEKSVLKAGGERRERLLITGEGGMGKIADTVPPAVPETYHSLCDRKTGRGGKGKSQTTPGKSSGKRRKRRGFKSKS